MNHTWVCACVFSGAPCASSHFGVPFFFCDDDNTKLPWGKPPELSLVSPGALDLLRANPADVPKRSSPGGVGGSSGALGDLLDAGRRRLLGESSSADLPAGQSPEKAPAGSLRDPQKMESSPKIRGSWTHLKGSWRLQAPCEGP